MAVTKAPGAGSRQWRLSHLTRAVARSLASAPGDQGSQSFKSQSETVDFHRPRQPPLAPPLAHAATFSRSPNTR
jgi:hypothetical protein